jgi:hypothetical protein
MKNARFGLLDIGGGSIEIVTATGIHIEEIFSLELGAVFLTENFLDKDPISGKQMASLRKHLRKTLRKELEQRFGTEYADFLRLMGAIRKKLLRKKHEPEVHKPLFEQLIRNDLLGLIRDQRTEDIDVLLRQILGEGYRYEELMQM